MGGRGVRVSLRWARCAVAAVAVAAAVVVMTGRAGAAIAPAQTDTFEDGLSDGWTQGVTSQQPPSVQAGGPDGAGDHYLLNVSVGGFGASSKMVMFNQSQWTGNYVAAGVTKLTADMANFGTSDLFMRLNLEDAAFNNFGSINAVDLPADGRWHSVTFDLTDAGLTNIGGTETVAQGLSNVIELRVLSAQGGPARNGDTVAGRLGMDNLHAVTATVPEPTGGCAVAMLAAGVLVRRRRG